MRCWNYEKTLLMSPDLKVSASALIVDYFSENSANIKFYIYFCSKRRKYGSV
jgi:hypothetical protein